MITILAPYGRNEVTSAAIRLAELVVGLGQEARLMACGVYERAVHPFWDERVVSGRKKDAVAKAASRSTAVVHFQCHQAWLESATLADTKARRARQILVPNWHGMSGREASLIPRFDAVVCPTRACKEVIRAEVFQGDKVGRDRLTFCRWDAGIPPVRREGTVEAGKLKAAVYCDAAAIDFCGPMVIQLAQELLAMFPKLDLSVVHLKSWSRRDKADLKRGQQRWDRRLRVHKLTNLFDLSKEFHAHDWAILPSVRADFGFSAARALACGTPVVCHDVEPFSELVSKDSGVLVPCEVRTGAARAPMAVPNLGRWAEACETALKDTRKLFGLQTKDWRLAELQAVFNNTWLHALDGDPKSTF